MCFNSLGTGPQQKMIFPSKSTLITWKIEHPPLTFSTWGNELLGINVLALPLGVKLFPTNLVQSFT